MNATWQRLAAVLAVVVCAAPARAEQGAGEGVDVTLEVAPCVRADSQRVRRLFELELGTSHADSAAAASGARVAVRCDGELVVLTVYDPVTGKSLSRAIDPGPPAGRDRLIALAVLELLVASWVELEATPEPIGRPTADDAAAAAARSSAREILRRRDPRWRTSVLAIAGSLLADQLHHGGGLRLTRTSSAGWGYSGDLSARRATDELAPGDVTISSLEISLALLRYHRRGALALLAGGGLRGALVALDGDASGRPDVMAGEVTGFAGGPLARIGVELLLVAGFTVGLTAEGGIHLLEVRGQVDGRDETGARGVWATGSLEVGWTF